MALTFDIIMRIILPNESLLVKILLVLSDVDNEKVFLVLIYCATGQNNCFCDVFTALLREFSSTYRTVLSEDFNFNQRVNNNIEKLIPLLSKFNF